MLCRFNSDSAAQAEKLQPGPTGRRRTKLKEPLHKSGRIKLGFKLIKIKARNASNSTAIAAFRNAEIDHFGPTLIAHGFCRGSLDL